MERFEKLEDRKQRLIRQAALAEFAAHGYAKASTNRIVKAAGIGKGMLFYYFTSKQELYEYLVKYSLEFIQSRYLDRVDAEEPDVIERLTQLARLKLEAQAENEEVFKFSAMFLQESEAHLPSDLTDKVGELKQGGYKLMYEGIDKSRFRKDADPEQVFQLIRWSIDGFQQDLLAKLAGQTLADIDFAPYWDEFYGYLAILKRSFYETEGESS
ncbi:TetR/AcrR family transcriptional regulator [Planococcus maritimus]|uniref:TetR/AcrR family transcriptional regulator n=1 Tax=Planococcus maritimus TaxID=192421 RepID=A0A7D7SHB5_PLAMR|nr:TetR/AcrR family transcriptional regulator [Planococcus maritimus]QMT17705.1 TetR/AcrR family transcriptional regulator [Planococcus maritimus]